MAKKIEICGVTLADIRDRYPDLPGFACSNRHEMSSLIGIAIHHDAAEFAEGDWDYNGTTLDEDVERLDIIYRCCKDVLGGFPYPMVASPNGRLWLCRDLDTWGAHVAQRNDELGGIAIMANFTGKAPSDKALCAASQGIVLYRRLAGKELFAGGHHWYALQSYSTACPGDIQNYWLPKLRDLAEYNGRTA